MARILQKNPFAWVQRSGWDGYFTNLSCSAVASRIVVPIDAAGPRPLLERGYPGALTLRQSSWVACGEVSRAKCPEPCKWPNLPGCSGHQRCDVRV